MLSFLWLNCLLLPFSSHGFSVVRPRNNRLHTARTLETPVVLFVSTEDESIPSMDWLTDGLKNGKKEEIVPPNGDMTKAKTYMEEHEGHGDLGDVPIPTTGVSIADEMEEASRDQFYTEVVRIQGLSKGVRAAQIVTTSNTGAFDPVRYLVGLSKQKAPTDESSPDTDTGDVNDDSFVMVDIPPYSTKLVGEMEKFMGLKGKLSAILVTSRDCIHYDEPAGVYTIRQADLLKWAKAFPETEIVAYRLDVPRDCRGYVTQRLDGYGPFAMQEEAVEGSKQKNITFVETGRPLTLALWSHDVAEDVLAGKRTPPEDEIIVEQDDQYSPEAIRAREKDKRVLAVYTPGRSFGSMSYVFPEIELCASGFTIPVEDSREDVNPGLDSTGPALDCRGYITTSRAGISRQTESARTLIQNYADRFTVLLPSSRGDPFFLDGNAEERAKELMDIVDQYERVGEIYEQLGITEY